MKIYPAIDIRGGNAVRLAQGDYQRETIYSLNPVDVARKFKTAGATCLHVVDLDGALEGELVNKDIIKNIVSQTGLFVEVGGGVREEEVVRRYLDAGACRGCERCVRETGCPALSMAAPAQGARHGVAQVDATLCYGCDLCVRSCAFGAISTPRAGTAPAERDALRRGAK